MTPIPHQVAAIVGDIPIHGALGFTRRVRRPGAAAEGDGIKVGA